MRRAPGRSFGFVVGGVVLATVGGCAPAPRGPGRPSLLEIAGAAPEQRTPGVWRYHPRANAPLLVSLKLGTTRLLAGERGERWLAGERVRSAADLAPEPLISAQRGGVGFVFVGRSGASYEAESPLGPFVRASAPDEPLANVVAEGGSILGIARDGSLVHTRDAGASWETVGPPDARFVDLALLDRGAGLALAVPEQLWQARDAGHGWERVDVPSLGALELEAQGASVLISSSLGAWRWSPGGSPPLEHLSSRPPGKPADRVELGKKPPRGPDAAALADGQALILDRSYVEVARREGGDGWELWSGAFDAELKRQGVAALKGCTAAKLAAFGRVLEIACTRDPLGDAAPRIVFYRSTGGSKLVTEDFEAHGRFADFRLVLARDGALLVSGICADSALKGCKARGVHYRRLQQEKDARERARDSGRSADRTQKPGHATARGDGKRRHELALAATPSLRGAAEALAVSPDGRRVYAVGPRVKSGSYALFVSRDGGKSFEARELSNVQAGPPVPDEYWPERSYGGLGVDALGVGDDGSVALLFRRYGELVLMTSDEEGRLLSVARPPGEARLIGAVGTHALAVAGTSGEAWESLDAGASWAPLGRTGFAPCPSDNQCAVPIRCAVAGCVLGRELSRVGWGTRSDAPAPELLLPPASGQSDLFERRAREPIGCTLDERPWAALEGADRAPEAQQAAIGDVAWFLEAESAARAASFVWHGLGGKRAGVERRELLRPAGTPQMMALYTSLQVEGVAAMRFPVGGPELGPVELAWENLVERRLLTARLQRAGTLSPSDYQLRPGGARLARPALLSIAQDGIYIRPHGTSRDAQVTYFLDGKRSVELPPVSWPSAPGFTEMAHPDGTHMPFAISGSGATLTTARREQGGWSFEALTTGLVRPEAFDLAQDWDLAYDEGNAGIAVVFWDPQGTYRRGYFYRLMAGDRAAAAPEPIPTLLDAPDRPRACSSTQRGKTPRIVVPVMAGTRHPVLVSDATEPLRVLLSAAAVMHGTPNDPCVAALDAQRVPEPDAPEPVDERALILLDDLEHAWLFRTTPMDGERLSIEYRTMNCRFEPGAEVPALVYEQPGTKVRR